MRYAAGLTKNQPLTDVSGKSLLTELKADATGKTFRFRYSPAATDLRWRVQASSALEFWTKTLFDSETAAPIVEGGWVSVAIPASLSETSTETDPRMFFRLEVSSP